MKRRRLCKVISMLLIAALLVAGCGKKAAEVKDGAIYVTDTESFWVGVGTAYISFEHHAQPETTSADDKTLYGDVFYIYVSSGKEFETWLSGTWSIEDNSDGDGTLTLNATWDDSQDNYTGLADGTSGKDTVYQSDDGKYKIKVKLPSAEVTFTLDPEKNKVEETSVK